MQNASAAAAVAVIVVVPVAVAVAILPPPLLQEISALSQTTFRCRFPLVENIYIFAAILCVMHRERFLFLSFFLSSTIIYRAIYKSWRRVFSCTSLPFFLFFFYHGRGESTREIHAAEKRTRATQGSEERERRRGVSVRRLAYPAKLCIFRRTKRNETKRNGTKRNETKRKPRNANARERRLARVQRLLLHTGCNHVERRAFHTIQSSSLR